MQFSGFLHDLKTGTIFKIGRIPVKTPPGSQPDLGTPDDKHLMRLSPCKAGFGVAKWLFKGFMLDFSISNKIF